MADIKETNWVFEKRNGMKVSMNGLLGRVAAHMKHSGPSYPDYSYPDYSYSLKELLKHLHEVGDAFYSNDLEKIDEFLQCYCLDEKRQEPPKE